VNSNSELRDEKVKLQQAEANASGAMCGRLSTRTNGNNANHHLWSNGRLWWLHYTVHLPNYTKRRVRRSLNTANLSVARQRRDAALAGHPPGDAVKLKVTFTHTKFLVPINFGRFNSGDASGTQPGRHPLTSRAPRRTPRVPAQNFAGAEPQEGKAK
jgi:hypothetical protein